MTFKDELLNNRYLTLKKYRSMSPFFDQELNAHILLKFEEILDFFKHKAISSNRKEKQFENLSGCPFSKDIVSFYGNWLMYMDGEKHLEYRKIISNALSVSMKSIDEYVHSAIEREIKTKLSKIHHSYDLISNISHPFLISVLSELFGIDQSDYEKMINLSKPIVSLISSGTLGSEEDRKNVANSLGITELFLE